MTEVHKINIAKEFTDTPGARDYEDGNFSGQEFYEKLLLPKFKKILESEEVLLIDFDECYGFASSFISGSFGRLSREYDSRTVLRHLSFKSDDEPLLIEQVKNTIKKPN